MGKIFMKVLLIAIRNIVIFLIQINVQMCTQKFWATEITLIINIVAEPEPEEQQHFAGAGTEIFLPGSGYLNSYKRLQKPLNFSYSNLK
jgi:hypothetical protein